MTRAQRMCKRKRPYRRGQAREQARLYSQRPYHCPICHRYHLTSKTLKLDLGYGVRVWV